MAILEALRIYCIAYQHSLIVESNLLNAISWVKYFRGSLEDAALLNDIQALASKSRVSFEHVSGFTNGMTDTLAKQRVVRSCNLSAFSV